MGHRPNEARLREELIRFSRLCYERRLLVAMDGNLSVRLSDELVLCTKAGCHKGFLTDADLVVVDMDGRKVRGAGSPTSEMAMHLAAYRTRPDIEAVVHAHPPMCVAFTVAGVSMARCVLPEVVLTLGSIPTLPYETTGTSELADLVGTSFANHDAVMMDRHGAVCAGTSLLDAFCKLETMEHTAQIMKWARDLGAMQTLDPAEAVKLRSMGLKRYGGPPSAVARADDEHADLPAACIDCSGCGTPTAGGLATRAAFSVARVSATPVVPQSQVALEREVRRAIAEVLG
ncbi:MAG: class II aldolase/adducin family protein [Deltaproteobacteria bacterium]|nr:class II aldolase/adducin family protein [Deltaproteobacteria bacterium]